MVLNATNPEFVKLCGALDDFEGYVDHFYLDTEGNVTIGRGHLVRNPDLAVNLGVFYQRDNPMVAARDSEILNDYSVVKGAKWGQEYPASYYTPKCVTRLSHRSIDRVFAGDLLGFQDQLQALLPGYMGWPKPAKAAILDMAFNMGVDTLRTKFPRFMGFARKGDFLGMASESTRTEKNENAKKRNLWTVAQFKAAAALGVVA